MSSRQSINRKIKWLELSKSYWMLILALMVPGVIGAILGFSYGVSTFEAEAGSKSWFWQSWHIFDYFVVCLVWGIGVGVSFIWIFRMVAKRLCRD